MKVAELKKLLDNFPEDAEIRIGDDCPDDFYSYCTPFSEKYIHLDPNDGYIYFGFFERFKTNNKSE